MIVVLFSGVLVEVPSAATSPLLDAYEVFKTGPLYKKYKQTNFNEASRVDAYWYGGPETTATSATGKGLLGWATFHRSL